MKIGRADSLIILLFLALSLITSWSSVASGGYFIYRDENPLISTGSLGEYFIHIYKNDNSPDIDFEKRIPLLWLNLVMSQELIDRFKFPAVAFLTLVVSYLVSRRILENEGIPETHRTLISAAAAVFYLINPLSTQIFLSFFPMLNYAVFPLFFYLLHDGFVRQSSRSLFLSALLAALMFLMVVHSILHIAISIIALIPLLIARKPKFPDLARSAAIFAAVFILASLFATLPYLFIYQVSQAPVGVFPPSIQDLRMFSAASVLPRAMLLDFRSYWWPYVDYKYPLGDFFFVPAFIFAAVLFACALFDRSGWPAAAMGALAFLFFFSKGNAAPFGGIYEFLNFTLPMGWLLRVPMKFLFTIPFFMCLLFIMASARFSRSGGKILGIWLAFSLAFLCVFTWPFFTGNMNGVLEKTDITGVESQYSSMNAIFSADRPALLDAINVDYYQRFLIATDFSRGGYFINRELGAYSANADWKSVRAFSVPGFQYLLLFSNRSAGLADSADEVYAGPDYSLYRLKETSSPLSTSGFSWLCYCHMDAARSILRDDPANLSRGLLFFPYTAPDFPGGQIDAADYVVLDSSAPIAASVPEKELISFYPSTLNTKSELGWARTGFEVREGIIIPEPDFGKGFATSVARKKKNTVPPATNISARFDVGRDGDYDIFLRMLEGNKSGAVRVFIDGSFVDQTTAVANGPERLRWQNVFSGTLGGGSHNITLEESGSPNAVNVGLVRAAGEAGYPDFSSKTVIYRLIGNSDFSSKRAYPFQDSSSSSFSYLATNRPAYSSIYVLAPGTYRVSYSAFGAGAIKIDGKNVTNGSAYLTRGNHSISVQPETEGGLMLLDHVTLIRPAPSANAGRLGQASIVNYTRADPSHYAILVNSTGPYLLSFARDYSPDWVARVGSTAYPPSPSYYSFTTYLINETGLHTVELEYTPQRWMYVGMAAGVAGLVLTGFLVFRKPRPLQDSSPRPNVMRPAAPLTRAGLKADLLDAQAAVASLLLIAVSVAYIWALNDFILLAIPLAALASLYLSGPSFKTHLAILLAASLFLSTSLLFVSSPLYGYSGAVTLAFFAAAALAVILDYLGWPGKKRNARKRV